MEEQREQHEECGVVWGDARAEFDSLIPDRFSQTLKLRQQFYLANQVAPSCVKRAAKAAYGPCQYRGTGNFCKVSLGVRLSLVSTGQLTLTKFSEPLDEATRVRYNERVRRKQVFDLQTNGLVVKQISRQSSKLESPVQFWAGLLANA